MSSENTLTSTAATTGSEKGPWGFWATLGFFVVIYIAMELVGVITMIAYIASGTIFIDGFDARTFVVSLQNNASFGFVNFLLVLVIVVPLIFLIVWARKGPSIREYLGLVKVPVRKVTPWLVRVLLLVAVSDALTSYLGRPIVNDFMVGYFNSGPLVFVLIAIIVVAPLLEEILIRGFLFKGLRHSVVGLHGAVFITAIIWSLMHYHYDLYEIGVIFLLGIFMGYARHATGSIYTTIAIHMLVNTVSGIQTAYFCSQI